MTRPLSNDIRERLVVAVDGGMTRRSAAKRFGVAASTAIKWSLTSGGPGLSERARKAGIAARSGSRPMPRESWV